jgi:hypothetical protein
MLWLYLYLRICDYMTTITVQEFGDTQGLEFGMDYKQNLLYSKLDPLEYQIFNKTCRSGFIYDIFHCLHCKCLLGGGFCS